MGSSLKVIPEFCFVYWAQPKRINCLSHVTKPGITSFWPNLVGSVAHSESRVPALLLVCIWSTPVLLEKELQPSLGWPKILFRIHWLQKWILRNSFVKDSC